MTMNRALSGWVQAAVLAVFMMQLCGCSTAFVAAGAGVGAGAGAVAYVKGDLEADIQHTTFRTYQAALKALSELKLPVVEEETDTVAGMIKSRFADEKDVWIKIKATSDTTCKMSIRVGVFGNYERSLKILDTTKKYL